MHPNPLFRCDADALAARLLDGAGFGMVFAETPAGPRVAHAALLPAGAQRIQFHLARRNDLAPHLANSRALIVVNGPHGYVSPRWYADRATVPTWDYVALELEGVVRALDQAELETHLRALGQQAEAAIADGEAWSPGEVDGGSWARMRAALAGFEMIVDAARPTVKLSQNKPAAVRETIAVAHGLTGNAELASWLRDVSGAPA